MLAFSQKPTIGREDICLLTLLLLFKCANHRNKRPFVSTASEDLVGTLMTIGKVNNIFPIFHSNDGLLIYISKQYEMLDKQRAVIKGQARDFPCMLHILNSPNFKATNGVNFQQLLFSSLN